MRKLKIIKTFLLLWLLFMIICLVVLPLFHKEAVREEIQISSGKTNEISKERVRSIDNNTDALIWRLRLIEAARKRVVLTTFDFRDDSSGRDIMSALFHAAERGVKVQVLIDGLNGTLHLKNSENLRELAAHENVRVKFYNSLNLLKPWRINYRMHDKYLIADDSAYILGGRNTDNLFLGNYASSYNQDRDILVYETTPGRGNSYQQLQDYFEQIWKLPYCENYRKKKIHTQNLEKHYGELKKKYPQAFIRTDWEKETIETNGIELCVNPMEAENKEPRLWERLVYEMKQDNDILIQTPYIICNKKMYEDLTDICADNSKVEMVINAVESGSNPFGCTDYLNQKRKVQETGIHTYEYLGEQALHTKTILVGDHISIVGSCNLDMRSIYLDTEMMLVIDSQKLNADIRQQIEKLKTNSRHVSPDGVEEDGENYRPAKQKMSKKIFYGVLRVLIRPFRHLL